MSDVNEKLAGSLTAETTELIPFLPYLLQDFWELGSEPSIMVEMLSQFTNLANDVQVLDLACGKGAVSVKIAEKLGFYVKGIDIIPEFIEFSEQKAQEHNVSDLCDFVVGDINEAVQNEKDYDVVVFGAVGNVLGEPAEMLIKLKSTIKKSGHILIDECFLPDDGSQDDVQYNNYEFLTEKQWHRLFDDVGLEIVKTLSGDELVVNDNHSTDDGMALITTRANELIEKHPDKKEIFEGYINSQQNEYDDIDNNLIPVVWLLKKA